MKKDIFPSDNEASKMKPGPWPTDESVGGKANNPFQTPLNRTAEDRQERGKRP